MNIDDVDWANLEHAYGQATDVPKILADLGSGDEADSNNALYALYGSLCHQGTVYSATVAATPFIVELALRPDTLHRTELLNYLGMLIDELGEEPPDVSELDLPEGFDPAEIAERIAAQHRHVEAIGQAMGGHAADFAKLLEGELELAIAAATILRNLDEPGAAEKLTALLAKRPARYAIVLPTDSLAAAELAAELRPNLIDAPFLFFHGDTSALDEIIVEDPDDFPRELMDDAGEIAGELYADIVGYADPELGNFRFYADMSITELDEICAAQGWERVDVALDSTELELVSDGGKAWDDITAAERELLELFVDTLADAGWQETRPWHENLKSCGWNVSPQGVGRYFAADALLEVGLWLYDPIASAEVTGFVGEPHLRLVIQSGDDSSLPLRFYGDLDATLGVLVKQQRRVTPANYIEGFLGEMFDVCDLVLAEANGGLMKLERS